MIKTIFLGSNWESLETLKTLHNDNRFEIVAVITQADKPAGRKQILTPTLVKQYAVENNIPVHLTNNDPKRYQEALDLFKPELIVCKAFGEIVPGFFLEYPKYKSVNIHFSILPKYRGAVPIQSAILNGDSKTGVTFMLMSEGLDEGDILGIIEEEIKQDDTNQSLRERLVDISAKAMPNLLINWVEGKISPIKQDNSQATFCYQKDISKDKAEVTFELMEAVHVDRMIRALIPWPVAWCIFENKRMKLLKAKVSNISYDGNMKYNVIDKRLIIKCKEGFIELLEIQKEGKNPIQASQLINELS